MVWQITLAVGQSRPRVFRSEAALDTATTVTIKGSEFQIGTLPTRSEIHELHAHEHQGYGEATLR